MKRITKFMASVLMASMLVPVIGMNSTVEASTIESKVAVSYAAATEPTAEELQGKGTDYYDANEPNNSEDTATKIELGKAYAGELGNYERYRKFGTDKDYFQIDLKKDQTYWIQLGNFATTLGRTTLLIVVIDPDGKETSIKHDMQGLGIDFYNYVPAQDGTYYIRVYNFTNWDNKVVDNTNYTLKIDTKMPEFKVQDVKHEGDAYGDACEFNNFKYCAQKVELDKVYNCEVGNPNKADELGYTDVDFFTFEAQAGKVYRITFDGYLKKFSEKRYAIMSVQSVAKTVANCDYKMTRNEADFYDFEPKESGTYYVMINGYVKPDDFNGMDTSYKFSIKTVATPAPTKVPTKAPTKVPTATPNATATPKPTATATPTPTPFSATVEEFAERLYTTCLGRAAEESGKNYWASELKGGKTGAEVAEGFFFSQEFIDNKIDTKEYVTRLYKTFMGRRPDAKEVDYWVSEIKGGKTRKDVFDGFINSQEWADICLGYGIRSGGVMAPSFEKPASKDVKAFAERLYTTCLGRDAEKAGLDWWAAELANLRQTGTVAAEGFFFSDEFVGLKLDNKEYVTRLYRTFMGREPDQAGYDYWLGEMKKGSSRKDVFNGFSAAPEFADLCAKAGIMR